LISCRQPSTAKGNANARYLAFVKKADEKEFGAVASLFRAAEKAEEIHATITLT